MEHQNRMRSSLLLDLKFVIDNFIDCIQEAGTSKHLCIRPHKRLTNVRNIFAISNTR